MKRNQTIVRGGQEEGKEMNREDRERSNENVIWEGGREGGPLGYDGGGGVARVGDFFSQSEECNYETEQRKNHNWMTNVLPTITTVIGKPGARVNVGGEKGVGGRRKQEE